MHGLFPRSPAREESMATQDDLTPAHGISDHWVTFEGLDVVPGRSGATVRFRVFRQEGDREHYLSTLSFQVDEVGDGTDGLIARAHDQLINALRQMLFGADFMRRRYRPEPIEPSPPESERPEAEAETRAEEPAPDSQA